jgi:hypothetical protein
VREFSVRESFERGNGRRIEISSGGLSVFGFFFLLYSLIYE